MTEAATLDRGIVPVAPTRELRLGVLVSGRGTNLQALLDAARLEGYPARVVAVACNRPKAPALERARQAAVPARAFPVNRFASLAERDAAFVAYFREHQVDLLVTAGYDRVLAPCVLEAFPYRIVNVHPSLLPAFAGSLHAQADALRHGVKVSGCTVHFVTDQLDLGPIILQRAVPVLEGDTEDSLAARILVEEHLALPEAIRLLAEGRVRIEGNRTRILS